MNRQSPLTVIGGVGGDRGVDRSDDFPTVVIPPTITTNQRQWREGKVVVVGAVAPRRGC